MPNLIWAISTYISSNFSSILLLLLVLRYAVSLNKTKRLPKGPYGLPLIGYLPFLGKNPYFTLCKLSEKYGPIFTVSLGNEHIVILNDWHSIKDSLRKDAFLGRPEHSLFSTLTEVKSLIDDDQMSWREDRRVFETIFRTSLDSVFINKNLLNELKSLLIQLRKTNGNAIELRHNLSRSILQFFHRFTFGRHMLIAKPIFDATLLFNISILSGYSSWLGKLFYKCFDIFNHYKFSLFVKLLKYEMRTHYKTIKSESIRDLIDGYLLELKARKANKLPTTLSVDKLRANCQVFLSFGNEAFLACMEWSLITVAHYPHYQKILYDEINQVIGTQRVPEFHDEMRMPFTVAFLNEVLRWKTVLPFNFIRRTLEDATILGQFIPKDTLILSNIWAVHHDPSIWEDPFEFDPHRFLSDDGIALIDHEGFMPFSLGKRSCVAESFVRKLWFIYFVSILQKFSITILTDTDEQHFDEEFNFTIRPKGKIKMVFELRTQHSEEKSQQNQNQQDNINKQQVKLDS